MAFYLIKISLSVSVFHYSIMIYAVNVRFDYNIKFPLYHEALSDLSEFVYQVNKKKKKKKKNKQKLISHIFELK